MSSFNHQRFAVLAQASYLTIRRLNESLKDQRDKALNLAEKQNDAIKLMAGQLLALREENDRLRRVRG